MSWHFWKDLGQPYGHPQWKLTANSWIQGKEGLTGWYLIAGYQYTRHIKSLGLLNWSSTEFPNFGNIARDQQIMQVNVLQSHKKQGLMNWNCRPLYISFTLYGKLYILCNILYECGRFSWLYKEKLVKLLNYI